MLAHPYNPSSKDMEALPAVGGSTRSQHSEAEKQVELCQFEASLICRVSFRSARATQRKPCIEKKSKTKTKQVGDRSSGPTSTIHWVWGRLRVIKDPVSNKIKPNLQVLSVSLPHIEELFGVLSSCPYSVYILLYCVAPRHCCQSWFRNHKGNASI